MDNLLRFNSVWLVDDPQLFRKKVIKGEQINNLESKSNKKLSDSYLKKEAQKKFSWIQPVYEKTSGFIHFSKTFITTSSKLTHSSIETKISKFDKFVPEESRLEAIECMIAITKGLFLLFDEWFKIKNDENMISSSWLNK